MSMLGILGVLGGLSFGCGDGDPPPDAARRADASMEADASGEVDDAAVEIDASVDDTGMLALDDTGIDAAIERDAPSIDVSGPDVFVGTDARMPDAFVPPPDSPAPVDVGTDAARIGLGPVQCTPTLECPAGAGLCNDTAPGGVCSCFLGTEACPTGTTCDTDIGACIRTCANDLDCSAGMTCSTLTGRCAIRRCSASSLCPAPYVCSSAGSGFCRRPSCAGGAACPTSMTCVTEVCVEP